MTRVGAVLVLLPAAAAIAALAAPAQASVVSDAPVLVFAVDRVSFEGLLADPALRALAAEGAPALLSGSTTNRALEEGLSIVHAPPTSVSFQDLGPVDGPDGAASSEALAAAAAEIEGTLDGDVQDEVLVIVYTPDPSPAMLAAKDGLTGIVLATGPPHDLAVAMAGASGAAPVRTLTSDSTRRAGVVIADDILPTLLYFVHAPAPSDLPGSVMRLADEPAPFDLHARYLAYRRMSVPVQAAAEIYVTVAGLYGVAMLAAGERPSAAWLRLGGYAAATLVPLALALLLAGHLPTLSYATVPPFLVAATLAGTLVYAFVERSRGPLVAAAAIGLVALGALAIESTLGWTAAITPFLGGGELDGGRFYGMPNVEIGLLLGCSVFVASRVSAPAAGAALIAATGLFAGLPWTGANLGAAVTLFAAAGLWLGIRRSGRLGIREVAGTLAVTAAGTLVVLLVHRYLVSAPTHVTRFLEGRGGGLVDTALDRLGVGAKLIARNPFALVPVLGVPASLGVVLRPPAPLSDTFAVHPEWRHVALVILLASVVAYLANDSGAAALGLGFGTAVSAMLSVPLLERAGMMKA